MKLNFSKKIKKILKKKKKKMIKKKMAQAITIDVSFEEYFLFFCIFFIYVYFVYHFYARDDSDFAFITILFSIIVVFSAAAFLMYPPNSDNALKKEAMTIYWKKQHEDFVMKRKMEQLLQKYKEKHQKQKQDREILRIYYRLKRERLHALNTTGYYIK